jgi:hypothetical protein
VRHENLVKRKMNNVCGWNACVGLSIVEWVWKGTNEGDLKLIAVTKALNVAYGEDRFVVLCSIPE